MRALVIGDLEATRATCSMLAARGIEVVHLPGPGDAELRERLDDSFEAVAVLVRRDVTALRYVLLIESLRPGIRLAATVFDNTLAAKLRAVVPNCTVASPADIAVPSIVGACLGAGTLAVDISAEGDPRRLVRGEGDEVRLEEYRPANLRPFRLVRRLLGAYGAHDDATRVLLLGLTGLVGILATDWILMITTLHLSPTEALYAATRVVTTVGPGDADQHGGAWYVVLSSVFMMVTVILTAVFTAGVVDRLMSSRSLALVGRRMPPRCDHVLVVGLGQVGLRLALALRQLRVPVLVVERDPAAANLRLARGAGIPVLTGNAHDIAVLRRAGIARARAVAAMGSDDLDNIEVAIAASAVAPAVPVALRAGENDLIAETRSLFRLGEVQDVSSLTAAAIAEAVAGSGRRLVFADGDRIRIFDGEEAADAARAGRCACA